MSFLKRHIYRCACCHEDLQTTPGPPRIKPGSSYSDAMILDVAVSKYCDLIPMDRYCKIAARSGMVGLPANSLIECTHYLAQKLKPVVELIKSEVFASKVLHADETTHRMLEGDKKEHWFLWGFSNSTARYYELHNTRSGEVASKLLIHSACEFLVTDVYSGYGKAVRETNDLRKQHHKTEILQVFCNAHARRRFIEAEDSFPEESEFFIQNYARIYTLEDEAKGKPPDEILKLRIKMRFIFAEMREWALRYGETFSSKSSIGRGLAYFLNHYDGLTLFLKYPDLPIDNHPGERTLKNHVVGRKTWYGTHSKQGAATAAILYTLIESAKLNHVNPRAYLTALVEASHQGRPLFTPFQYQASSSVPKSA